MTQRRPPRVTSSHHLAIAALRLAAVFAVAAAAWSVVVAIAGGSWWGPAHTALAGGVLLAISGIAHMFGVMLSMAPSPKPQIAAAQRWSLAIGVAAVLVGFPTRLGWLVGAGAVLALGGLVLLAISIIEATRFSFARRFRLSSRFYLLSIVSGLVGITLGGLVGAGILTDVDAVVAHAHLNLVGMIGFAITGAIPTFLPTLVSHRMVSGEEAMAALWLAVAATVSMIAGAFVGQGAVGVGVGVAGLAMAVVLVGVLARLGIRGADLGGLAYIQVSLGSGWLVLWAFVDAVRLLDEGLVRVLDGWTGAAIVAGIGQVMAGALCYILPVLAGPAPRLGRNLGRMDRRRWLPLGAANVAGIALVVGAWPVAGALGAIWFVDFAWRLTHLEWADPSESATAPTGPDVD